LHIHGVLGVPGVQAALCLPFPCKTTGDIDHCVNLAEIFPGLLHPTRRTEGGYNVFDSKTLGRLRFLRAAFESGIRLDQLTRLCRALDAGDSEDLHGCVEQLRRKIDVRRKELMVIETSLGELASSA